MVFLVILIFKYQLLKSTRREAREKDDDLWNTLNSSDGPEAYQGSWFRSLIVLKVVSLSFSGIKDFNGLRKQSLHFSQVTVFFLTFA